MTFSADSESPDVDTSGGETDGDTEHASEAEDDSEVSAPEILPNHQVIPES